MWAGASDSGRPRPGRVAAPCLVEVVRRPHLCGFASVLESFSLLITQDSATEPIYSRGRRKDVIRLSGQNMLPVIEFEDGSAYRAESPEMAETISAGGLFEQGGLSSPASQ